MCNELPFTQYLQVACVEIIFVPYWLARRFKPGIW